MVRAAAAAAAAAGTGTLLFVRQMHNAVRCMSIHSRRKEGRIKGQQVKPLPTTLHACEQSAGGLGDDGSALVPVLIAWLMAEAIRGASSKYAG